MEQQQGRVDEVISEVEELGPTEPRGREQQLADQLDQLRDQSADKVKQLQVDPRVNVSYHCIKSFCIHKNKKALVHSDPN